jgi:PTH1 family peptidyl-tRNA hydrolase
MSSGFLAVIGLGNPGARYAGTRHNIGFAVVDCLRLCAAVQQPADVRDIVKPRAADALSGRLDRDGWSDKGDALEAVTAVAGWRAGLLKPQTFMNRSGEPTQRYLAFKKIQLSQLIVVHDEIDLPLGVLRVKIDGGEGGHNGLRSISELCGGRGYTRVRVGVGKPPPGSPLASQPDGVATWVLGRYSAEEAPLAEELVIKAVEAVVCLGLKGVKEAQNRFNR